MTPPEPHLVLKAAATSGWTESWWTYLFRSEPPGSKEQDETRSTLCWSEHRIRKLGLIWVILRKVSGRGVSHWSSALGAVWDKGPQQLCLQAVGDQPAQMGQAARSFLVLGEGLVSVLQRKKHRGGAGVAYWGSEGPWYDPTDSNSTVAFSVGHGSEPKHRTNLFFHQQTAALMGALNCARGFISQLAANHGHLAYGYHRLLGYIGIATPQVPPP